MLTLFGHDDEKPIKPSLLERLKESVSKTRTEIASRVDTIFGTGQRLDAEHLRQLENALLAADLGVRTTRELIDAVRDTAGRQSMQDAIQLRGALKTQLLAVLAAVKPPAESNGTSGNTRPHVIFVVGVNGTGKTTTIGKLAHRLRQEGASVLLCAGDTFRAAASEQLAIWAQRTGSELIQQKSGADPRRRGFRRPDRGAGEKCGRGHRGHGRPAAHHVEPDGRVGKNETHRRQAGARRAA